MFFGPGYIQRCMFAFVICTILALIIDGAWIGATDYGTIGTLTYFKQYGTGMWVIPMTAIGFLAALPQMLLWDYSFFHSLGAVGGVFRFILAAVISIGFVWGFVTMLWPIIAQIAVAIARGVVGLLGRL